MRGAAIHSATATAAAPTATAAEQRDAIGLDFGGVALVAVLVVPLPRLQPALDVDLLALRQVLLQRFGLLAPQHHAVPFSLFLPLLILVVPHFRRGQIQRGNGGAAGRIAKLGVPSQVSHEDYFVDASHVALLRAAFARRRPLVSVGLRRRLR